MSKPTKFTVLSLALLLALLMAAVLPISALAQDEVPPVPAVEEIPPVEEGSTLVEETAPDAESALAEAEAAAAAEEEEEEEAPTVPEVLEALPEGADLVVLDESGDALPLVTEEAAEVVAAADPYFYDIGGVKRSFMIVCGTTPNCTETTAPIQTAVLAFVSKNGVGDIYVESGTYTENVTVDNSGGEYAGLTGLIGKNTGSGLPVLNGIITFDSLENVFTFQGFTINGDVTFEAGSGVLNVEDITQSGSGVGILISQNGEVNLENVSATGNNNYGISVQSMGMIAATLKDVNASNNGDGAYIGLYGGGNVTITDSQFNLNDYAGFGRGLNIDTAGTITLNNVTASGNTGYGAKIWSHPTTTLLIENSFFNDNRTGLLVDNEKGSDTWYGTVRYSEFNNNNMGIDAYGNYVLTNECNTFSGNRTDVFLGGGAIQVVVCSEPAGLLFEEGSERGFRSQNNLVPPLFVSVITVVSTPLDELPADLPEGKTLAASASLTLIQNGEEIESASESVQMTFDIPYGMEPPFTVLFWNGSEWIEIPSQVVDGKVVFSVTTHGVYVLAGQ